MIRDLNLKDGSKIAIIGGGPAGSYFAHFAQKWAEMKGIRITTTIFDGKDFLQRGPKGCNLCAGVIAESLNQKLKEEGIYLPEKRIINRVDGYCLHVNGESLFLPCEENETNTIATVFRGNGPRYSAFPGIISFDDFLLSWAQDKGAQVVSHPVWDIRVPRAKNEPASIFFGERKNPQRFDADLVVGAFGINSFLTEKIRNLGFGYIPPSTLTTYQAEYKLEKPEISKRFGNSIHVYIPRSKTIRYATVIPKGDYVTVTIIGNKNATQELFRDFLSLPEIRGKIPATKPHCFCYPKITVSPARNPFTHRLVMIGDASFSRHYKNGIESAFITAKLAAESAFRAGVDASSFRSNYYTQAKKLIIHDNSYGRLLFSINDIISSIPLLTESHLSLARKGSTGPAKKLRRILWNMFTGNIPYKDIFRISADLKLQTYLMWNTISLLFQRIKYLFGIADKNPSDVISTRPSQKPRCGRYHRWRSSRLQLRHKTEKTGHTERHQPQDHHL